MGRLGKKDVYYKDLCQIFKIPVLTGKAKEKQLTLLQEKGVSWRFSNGKFYGIIGSKEFPRIPESLVDIRVFLLMSALAEGLIDNYSTVELVEVPYQYLAETIGLVNSQFSAPVVDERLQEISLFKTAVKYQNSSIIEYLLQKLSTESLLPSRKSFRIICKGKLYVLSEKETADMFHIHREVLQELKVRKMSHLYPRGLVGKFYQRVEEILLFRYSITFCEPSIVFSVHKKIVQNYLQSFYDTQNNLWGILLKQSNSANILKLSKHFSIWWEDYVEFQKIKESNASQEELDKTFTKPVKLIFPSWEKELISLLIEISFKNSGE